MTVNTQRLAAEPVTKSPNEVLIIGVDFTLFGLAPNETLTGTPAVNVAGSTLVATDPTVNTNATFKNRKGGTVAIGRGAVFKLAGGTVGTDVDLLVSCTTSGGQTLEGVCPVEVRSK
jgi:hypothetical protein